MLSAHKVNLFMFSKFVLVSAFNTLLGCSIILFAMYPLNMSPERSNIMGYGIGVGVSYFLNRNFIFKSKLAKWGEFFRFFGVFSIAYTANLLILLKLIYKYGFSEGLSQIIAGIVYFFVSFFMNKWFVFRGASSP